MIEIKITGATPTEALISLAAMGLHCQADPLIDTAARQLLASGGGARKLSCPRCSRTRPSLPPPPLLPLLLQCRPLPRLPLPPHRRRLRPP